MQYVLFRENPNTHREVYLKRMLGEAAEWTENLAEAKKFASAKRAYAYGARFELEWWRVGQR